MSSLTYIMSGISMVLKNGKVCKRDNEKYANMVTDTIRDFKSEINFEMMFNAYHEDVLMDGYLSDTRFPPTVRLGTLQVNRRFNR